MYDDQPASTDRLIVQIHKTLDAHGMSELDTTDESDMYGALPSLSANTP
jgi:hypothetical protein